MLAIAALGLSSCKKTEQENPQPTHKGIACFNIVQHPEMKWMKLNGKDIGSINCYAIWMTFKKGDRIDMGVHSTEPLLKDIYFTVEGDTLRANGDNEAHLTYIIK